MRLIGARYLEKKKGSPITALPLNTMTRSRVVWFH